MEIILFQKLICDITKKGYALTFITINAGCSLKIEAHPLCTGLGASITIANNGNIFDALKALELRIH